MGNYIEQATKRARTHTDAEQKALLMVSGKRRSTIRDHLIFSIAFATGLRQHEIVALNVGDVFEKDEVKRYVRLRVFKKSNSDKKMQEIIIPPALKNKLQLFYAWKQEQGQSLAPEAPLFFSQRKTRLSTRQVRTLFDMWQERAGFERHTTFHMMRHTACTSLYKQKNDVRMVQVFARHKSINSTMVYTHATDEDMYRSVSELRC